MPSAEAEAMSPALPKGYSVQERDDASRRRLQARGKGHRGSWRAVRTDGEKYTGPWRHTWLEAYRDAEKHARGGR